MNNAAQNLLLACPPWRRAFAVQCDTVQAFHESCLDVLRDRCPLQPLDPKLLSLKRNLFSTLFIMATAAAGVAEEKLPFYAMLNQCLRAQVTGCDNLLDDEYKSVIPFDLPGGGIRFRSVLMIMTADAVLSRRILAEVAAGRMTEEEARRLQATALGVLIPSGIEEHEEESGGADAVPSVATMLQQVHFRKTGLLFEAPVRLAETMGDTDPERADRVAGALSDFGIGCQIIDDLNDVADDLACGKFNLVVSEACYGEDEQERERVLSLRNSVVSPEEVRRLAAALPAARSRCLGHSLAYFQR
ncbi:MAG: polyprenyl synthetase family protein, partial [Desulfuromonadaceae bacterium]